MTVTLTWISPRLDGQTQRLVWSTYTSNGGLDRSIVVSFSAAGMPERNQA